MTDPTSQNSPGGAPGDVLADRYHLTRRLASGGMASVWQATDNVLERDVAIKILHPHLAADESFVARFRTEAVAAARLRHSNIVSIYDTYSGNDIEAIVLELVRGRNLRVYLDDHGPLHPAEAVHITAEVADALAASHRAGLVHRDIKPANILIRDDGQVLVTDFGIAKLHNRAGDLTQTGMMLGSVKYLAPEQVQGGEVDARTDIYALGVVLYEELTGRPPFHADTDAATALARLHERPMLPRQIRPGIPKDLEDIVMRAMATEPDRRFSSAVDMRAALLAATTSGDPTVAVAAPRITVPQESVAPGARPAPSNPDPSPTFAQSERRWLVPTLVIILIASAFALAGVLIGQTDAGQGLIDRVSSAVSNNDDPPESSSDVSTVSLVQVSDYDPEAGDGEHPEEVQFAFDGDPSTVWTTETYDQRDMGTKRGVGLLIELPEPLSLDGLEVRSPTTDWAAEVYLGDTAGADIDEWGSPIASQENINGDATFDLDGATGRFVVLWLTDLGVGDGTGSQVVVSDVVILARG